VSFGTVKIVAQWLCTSSTKSSPAAKLPTWKQRKWNEVSKIILTMLRIHGIKVPDTIESVLTDMPKHADGATFISENKARSPKVAAMRRNFLHTMALLTIKHQQVVVEVSILVDVGV
jgi:hypothetical protein